MCMYKTTGKLVKKSFKESVVGQVYDKEMKKMEPDTVKQKSRYVPEPKKPKKPKVNSVSSLQITKDY